MTQAPTLPQWARVNAVLQVEVENIGWSCFRIYHIGHDTGTIYMVKHDEPDFLETIVISEHLVDGQLVLPDDMLVTEPSREVQRG